MLLDCELPRRRVLQLGGLAALVPFLPSVAAAQPAHAAGTTVSMATTAASLSHPTLPKNALWYGVPATSWDQHALPIGNGRLGAMLFGNPDEEVVQFNEISLWGGVNNYDNALAGVGDSAYDLSMTGFGSYKNFGDLRLRFGAVNSVTAPGGPYQDSSASQTVAQTYDGNVNTKWCIIAPPAHVFWQAKLVSPATVTSYSLTSAEDVPDRDPQQWKFQGSQDGTTWVDLDSRTGAPFEQRRLTKTFTFANTTAYTYYRFDIVPKAGISHFQVAEIALGGVSLVSGGSVVYVSSPSGHAGEVSEQLTATTDADPATAWRVADVGAGASWQLELTSGRALTSYVLTSADNPAEDPRDFRLEASNDARTWTTLDTRTGNTFASRGEAKTFTFANTASYALYRLTFTGPAAVKIAGIALTGSGFDTRTQRPVAGYRRALDTTAGVHYTQFASLAGEVLREAFVSRDAEAILLRYSTDAPGGFAADVSFTSAQTAPTTADAATAALSFNGALGNGLSYAATARILHTDGQVDQNGNTLRVSGASSITIAVDARTNYKMSAADGWRGVEPRPVVDATLAALDDASFDTLRDEHVAAFSAIMSRASATWGETDAAVQALSTSRRLSRYIAGETDPTLEQSLFDYGRYLLIGSSRSDGLPANLQGLWNNSNNPPWAADYHTNINVQMNYWAAETTNLPEMHESLVSFIQQVAVPSRVATRNAFGQDTPGWTARTSQNIFGGNAWLWNTVASAWYMQHVYEHWAFTQDREYLANTAYPMIKEICEFWAHRLKELPDGTLVSPNGWSPEHGPHEDGVMYDQQIIWDLFQNYLDCADALDIDPDYRATVADLQARLAPNKIGSWGQLQEWQVDRDSPTDIHRHTSHLFAVFPGRQISPSTTPEFAAAALVSLKARCGEREGVPFTEATVSGDSRQSWTWPWRAALFARLGDAERARYMLRGLLRFNVTGNLFARASGVFQMDGDFGMPAAVVELLLQSHAGIHLLPALPSSWATGSFTGLRARGGYEIDAEWSNGQVTAFTVTADRAPHTRPIRVRVNGEDRKIAPAVPSTGAAMSDLGVWTSPEATVNAGTRALGNKIVVTVDAQNLEAVPIDIEITTVYGSKTFTAVAPGARVFHAFTTRKSSIPAGQVSVDLSATIGGQRVSRSLTVDYAARG